MATLLCRVLGHHVAPARSSPAGGITVPDAGWTWKSDPLSVAGDAEAWAHVQQWTGAAPWGCAGADVLAKWHEQAH